jgi:hypothetical protein
MTFDQLKNVITSDSLIVKSEFMVLVAVKKWVTHKPTEEAEDRKKHLKPLLELVRFPLMTREDLDMVENDELIMKEPGMQYVPSNFLE